MHSSGGCRIVLGPSDGLNFQFSLPNKLFDYLHAGVPVVCSDLPVAGRFVREEGMGVVAKAAQGEDAIARSIAEAVGELLDGPPNGFGRGGPASPLGGAHRHPVGGFAPPRLKGQARFQRALHVSQRESRPWPTRVS